jgi:hypothetical protein
MWAKDGQNTVFCVDGVNMEWSFGEGAGGATLWLPTGEGEPKEVDLALNAFDLEWVVGGGDPLSASNVDPVALISHELGHWLGLAHSPDPYATMYYAHLPFGIQATPAGDDKAGVCTLYPSGVNECSATDDCPADHECVTIQDVPVCDETHDPAGSPCSITSIDCDDMCWVSFYECSQMCLFTTADYSDGYCAPLCETTECPPGFVCTHVQQPGVDVHLCFLDSSPPEPVDTAAEPQAEPGPDTAELAAGPDTAEEIVQPDAGGGELAAPAVDSAQDQVQAAEATPEAAPADAAAAGNGSGGGGGGCGVGQGGAGPLAALLALMCFALRRRA